jgi:hypothetical protein
MHKLIASLILFAAFPAHCVWQWQGLLPTPESASIQSQHQDARQAQGKAEDGPYVLWEGESANVHWIRGGKHIVEKNNAPFTLPIPALGPAAKVLLDGRPYARAAAELPKAQKIFAISDVHGRLDAMRDLLVAHKVMNGDGRWTFGNGHLVVNGDIADRGDMVTESYWLLRCLAGSARAAGGGVHMTIGNHEAMMMTGDLRYVNPSYMKQAEGMPDFAQLWGPQSELGRWLRSLPALLKIGDLLFVHGGVSPEFISRGLDIQSANKEMQMLPKAEREGLNAFLHSSSGPIWYRGMVLGDQRDSITQPDLEKILAHFGVKRIVVGHTTVDAVTALHGGKVIAIDAGMQLGKREGAYFENGKTYRALADGSKVEMK